jgi:hypothetical protein
MFGNFNFVMPLLASDVNRDNYEQMTGLEVLMNNWGMNGSDVEWTDGDLNGDHFVDAEELEIADQNMGAGTYINLEST